MSLAGWSPTFGEPSSGTVCRTACIMRRKVSTQRQPTQFQLIWKVRSPVTGSVAIGNSYNTCLLVWPVPLTQLIFPSKTWFFGIYLKSLKIQYLPYSESKSYQINSIKSCSSRSFQHQRHIPIPLKFSVKKSFNIQELLHRKSKCHETKPMCPWELSKETKNVIWSLPVIQWILLVQTKQNKQTTFLRR
jgi:hypothetical protein